MPNVQQNTLFIKQKAQELGFDFCGIAEALPLYDEAKKLEKWLSQKMHGSMHYMENYFDIRINPQNLFPGAKSVITLLKNYYPAVKQPNHLPQVSKYAYGKDYHEVIRAQLKELLQQMQTQIGNINGRGFVDSAPVLERAWAVRSGLGWIGKNGNLINKKAGSFFFIATLIVDIPLVYDIGFNKDYCGTCTKCIDACPTQAILPNKVINGSKCISYFTIELKEMLIPNQYKQQFENWAFGCDTCQDVCPWNRFSQPHKESAFEPLQEIFSFNFEDWENLSEEAFKKIFKYSPIKRTKHKGIQRNIRFLKYGD